MTSADRGPTTGRPVAVVMVAPPGGPAVNLVRAAGEFFRTQAPGVNLVKVQEAFVKCQLERRAR